MAKIVIALGGNALGDNAQEQLERAQMVSRAVADLIVRGHNLVVVHGNGPQIGQIRLAFEEASRLGSVPLLPFAECTAMSQGYIGYHLQQAIDEELVARGYNSIPVVTMLTQVVVDPNDPAFQNPSKPVGGYYDEQTAKRLMAETHDVYREDAGRGWRRVVPSPRPIDIYEKMTLRTLINDNQVVIACGGGGIPVVYSGARYHGVDAVVDKDFAAAKLAHLVNADILLILTAVEHVYVNFNTPEQQAIVSMSCAEAEECIAEGEFAAGSMLPKVQAACEFVSGGEERRAVIAALEHASEAVGGLRGTRIAG
jgi:carbamate kinase